MSNISKIKNSRVIPYDQDPLSSSTLFAWGDNGGKELYNGTKMPSPLFFHGNELNNHKCSGRCGSKYCNCAGDEKHYNNFNWGNIFGGGGDDASLADDQIGKMPDEIKGGSGGKSKVSADQIMSGIESVTELAKLFGTKRELSEVEGVCGKQRALASKAKKQAWANCASAYMQSKLNTDKQSGQGLGTGAIVGIALGSVALLGGIIFIATRKKGQQQVIVMQAPVK